MLAMLVLDIAYVKWTGRMKQIINICFQIRITDLFDTLSYIFVYACVCCGSLSFVNAHAFAQQNIYGIIKKNFVLILELSTLSKIQQHCFIVHSAIQCWFLIAFFSLPFAVFHIFFSRPSSMCCSDSIVFFSWISFFFSSK